jgi:hypothetical protein
MAQRGIAMVIGTADWQESDRVQITYSYIGFQHADEKFSPQIDVTPSLLTGAALKAVIKNSIVNWYSEHQSANYDDWDNTPITGDTFALVGGIV